MTRPEAIDILNRAMTAEAALSVQLHNIVNTFSWSGLPEKHRRRVAESLGAIASLPAQRARRLRTIIEQLNGSEQDVL